MFEQSAVCYLSQRHVRKWAKNRKYNSQVKMRKDCWIDIVFVCGVVIIIICRTSVCQFASLLSDSKGKCCVVLCGLLIVSIFV